MCDVARVSRKRGFRYPICAAGLKGFFFKKTVFTRGLMGQAFLAGFTLWYMRLLEALVLPLRVVGKRGYVFLRVGGGWRGRKVYKILFFSLFLYRLE